MAGAAAGAVEAFTRQSRVTKPALGIRLGIVEQDLGETDVDPVGRGFIPDGAGRNEGRIHIFLETESGAGVVAQIGRIAGEELVVGGAELAMENARNWDLVRRREYHQIFDNYRHGSLAPILDLRDGKYFFVREYVQYTGRLLFKEKFYYRGIPGWNVSGLIKNPQQ